MRRAHSRVCVSPGGARSHRPRCTLQLFLTWVGKICSGQRQSESSLPPSALAGPMNLHCSRAQAQQEGKLSRSQWAGKYGKCQILCVPPGRRSRPHLAWVTPPSRACRPLLVGVFPPSPSPALTGPRCAGLLSSRSPSLGTRLPSPWPLAQWGPAAPAQPATNCRVWDFIPLVLQSPRPCLSFPGRCPNSQVMLRVADTSVT